MDEQETDKLAEKILPPTLLMKRRGLTRDRANYVTAVIQMRAKVRHLMETARDATVVEELLVLDSFLEDTITTIYYGDKPEAGGGDAA